MTDLTDLEESEMEGDEDWEEDDPVLAKVIAEELDKQQVSASVLHSDYHLTFTHLDYHTVYQLIPGTP